MLCNLLLVGWVGPAIWSGLALWPRLRRRGDFYPDAVETGLVGAVSREADSVEPAPPHHHLVQATPSMAKGEVLSNGVIGEKVVGEDADGGDKYH